MLKKILILILSIQSCFGVIQNIRVFAKGKKQVILVSNYSFIFWYQKTQAECIADSGRDSKVLVDSANKEILLEALTLLGKTGQKGILLYEGNEDKIAFARKMVAEGRNPYIPLHAICSFIAPQYNYKIGNIELRSADLRDGSVNHLEGYLAELDASKDANLTEKERAMHKKICAESLENYFARLECQVTLKELQNKIAKYKLSEQALTNVAARVARIELDVNNFKDFLKDTCNRKKPFVDALLTLKSSKEGSEIITDCPKHLPCIEFAKLSMIAHCLEAISETDVVIVVADYFYTDKIAKVIGYTGFEEVATFGEPSYDAIVKQRYTFTSKDLKEAFASLIQIKCGNKNCDGILPAELQCARCKKVCYCSQQCQKAHWKEHKKECVAVAAAAAQK